MKFRFFLDEIQLPKEEPLHFLRILRCIKAALTYPGKTYRKNKQQKNVAPPQKRKMMFLKSMPAPDFNNLYDDTML